jgi:hypothetical protein
VKAAFEFVHCANVRTSQACNLDAGFSQMGGARRIWIWAAQAVEMGDGGADTSEADGKL